MELHPRCGWQETAWIAESRLCTAARPGTRWAFQVPRVSVATNAW